MTKREPSSDKRRAVLRFLQELPDDEINTTDIPEVLDWPGAQRGVFYRPEQRQITLRLDADITSWFKVRAQAGRLRDRYQSRPARACRAVRKGSHEMTNWENCAASEMMKT